MGRLSTCGLPELRTLPNANVHFLTLDGRPIRGLRSLFDGLVPLSVPIDIAPKTEIIMTASNRKTVASRIVETLPLQPKP